jgi:hypothetical protein
MLAFFIVFALFLPTKGFAESEFATLRELVGASEAWTKDTKRIKGTSTLGALSIAAMGIGGMQLAQGLSEHKADQEAAADMAAYLDAIRCGVSGTKNVRYDEVGRTPEDDMDFIQARLEYMRIAQQTKAAKESLGLPPGLEAEVIIDTSSLYFDRTVNQGGVTNQFSTAQERLDSGSGKKRATIGGAVAGAGLVMGIADQSGAAAGTLRDTAHTVGVRR